VTPRSTRYEREPYRERKTTLVLETILLEHLSYLYLCVVYTSTKLVRQLGHGGYVCPLLER
jgi:hypothetical protein